MNHANQILGVVPRVLWSQKLDEVHIGRPRINKNKSKCHRGDKMGKITLPVCYCSLTYHRELSRCYAITHLNSLEKQIFTDRKMFCLQIRINKNDKSNQSKLTSQ